MPIVFVSWIFLFADTQINVTAVNNLDLGQATVIGEEFEPWIAPTIIVLVLVAVLLGVMFCCCMVKFKCYIYTFIMRQEEIKEYTEHELLVHHTENTEV